MFSLNAFAMLVICCVKTQTLIPFCLARNAKSTSSFVLCFTSLEAAQSSRMISVLVPSYTLLIILSQSSIWFWSRVKIIKCPYHFLQNRHMSCCGWMLDRGERCNQTLLGRWCSRRLNSYLVFAEFVGPTTNAFNRILSGFIFFLLIWFIVTMKKSWYVIFLLCSYHH